MPPKTARAVSVPASSAAPPSSRLLALLGKRPALLALGFTLLATIRIVATYGVFNHTMDEPAHIACGMEWLANGTYRIEAQHPPLARAATALGPWLVGIPFPAKTKEGEQDMHTRGLQILTYRDRYARNLALSRIGILPFFWLGCLVCYWWGKRISAEAAALAVLCFSVIPTVLAHAGLATTDMALAACLGAAFLAAVRWAEVPTLKRAAIFGAAAGAALLCKHSALAFFPAASGFAVLWYWITAKATRREMAARAWRMVPGLALASALVFVMIWAMFRFSYGPTPLLPFKVPFPEYFNGIHEVSVHNQEGHLSYLMGELSWTGFRLFYPVALGVKTPIGLLAILAAALWLAWRKPASMRGVGLATAYGGGILMVGLFSQINIGVRHVLPVFMAFSVIAAAAMAELLRASTPRQVQWATVAAGLWFCVSSLAAHPDYLPYFNAFAGNEPETVLADSDLDWGQDCLRLSSRLRELGANEVFFSPFVNADFERQFGFPSTYAVMPLQPGPGWNAVSLSALKVLRLGLRTREPGAVLWPYRFKPVERVGKSILLYYFPPEQFQK